MKKFSYLLAPLENTSDSALRTLCYNHGADLTFTEMTRLKGLIKKNKATWRKIELKDATPTIIQLLVSNERDVEVFLKNFKPSLGFKGFNLNFGCPSPDVIKIGLGCAMIKRIEKTKRIVAVFKKYNYPISIKIRLGLNAYEKNKKVYLNLIKNVDCDFIIHARHGKENYENKPDYSIFKDCVETGKKIFANGDIDTKEKVEKLKKIGVAGVMIGRRAVQNPGIFNLLKKREEPNFNQLINEYKELSEKYKSLPRYKKNVLSRLGKKESYYHNSQG